MRVYNILKSKLFPESLVLMTIVIFLYNGHINYTWGQSKQLKHLTEKEYHLWGNLSLSNLSPKGDWISYRMSYQDGIDILFVKGITKDRTFAIPNSYYGAFSQTNWFAALSPKGLEVLNLKTGNRRTIKDVNSFYFSSSGNELILGILENENELQLKIISPAGLLKLKISNITEFKLNPQKEMLVYATHDQLGGGLGIIELKQNLKHSKIDTINSGAYSNITWSKNGLAVTCVKNLNDVSEKNLQGLLLFDILKNKVKELNSLTTSSFSSKNHILSGIQQRLVISDDLKRVFVQFENGNNIKDSIIDHVEIWNSFDKYIFPEEQLWKLRNTARVGVWTPNSKTFQKITSDSLPKLMLTGNEDYALVFNPKAYEPQFDQFGPMDFYLTNLVNGESKLFLEAHSANQYHTMPSPDGKYIAYFKNKNWWAYNIRERSHINLTSGMNLKFEDISNDMAGKKNAYGIAGWTKNDKSVILYDAFDLWEIEPLTGKPLRLTHGREKNISFRIQANDDHIYEPIYNGQSVKEVNLEEELILSAYMQNGDSGLYKWNKNKAEHELVMASSKIDFFRQSRTGVIYQEQRYDLSPRINLKLKNGQNRVIFQSNPQQQEYYWGSAKPIIFKNSLNQDIKGFIYYPSNYDSLKKYPMIVHIYEQQFKDFHEYISPDKNSPIGFNPTNYTLQDYVVFFPDISYQMGDPANSAVDCVTAGVKYVIDLGIVDKDKIGLIGHSFGGFETNFIMTQSDLFATAVSGAGMSDLQSLYLTLNWWTGKPDMWRFENQQMRMGQSLFEARDTYYRNSPINYVENINKPILSWSGKNDLQVDWHQNIEWYLALRRLNKEHVLLLYPDETHFILMEENQKDLNHKIQDWFSYYLKDNPVPSWVKP